MNKQLCREVMVDLGRCIDRMAEGGYEKDASWLCATMCNAMYYMCMSFRRMNNELLPNYKEVAELHFKSAIKALHAACLRYADAPSERELEGIVGGMKALHVFNMARQSLNQIFSSSQADKESSASYSDISHSGNSEVCV